ncbi:excalibur calcium-binding domain-containing protein [Rothia mucilaginosa]|uniref:excalibur calcium-binding domain-containing protein n=1 Tax=Rothia mucilaginosa TaxID=43675 RepID=UPI00195923D4|nr:excalibur calcium-binding domain-containing protein [Rothia mucilaginosa]
MSIRNNIARIGATALISCGLVATTVPATFADEAAQEISHTYADSARLITPDTWVEGQGLIIAGEGFKTADGTSGSVLALKLNKGAVKIDGQDYMEIHADESGNFTVTVPWQSELKGQVSVDLYLLSGSMKDGDVPRGGKAATVTIQAVKDSLPAPAPSASTEPTPAPSASTEPTPEPSKSAEPTPAPSEASPSASASEEPSAPAVEDAKETKPAEDQKSDEASDSSAKDEKAYKYQNCADVWADRGGPIYKGDPDFRDKFDANNNNVGCEEQPNYENSTSDNDNLGSSSSNDNLDSGSGSSNASSKSSASLAKTGASGAMTAAGLGLIALGAGGAVVVATRMRKKA